MSIVLKNKMKFLFLNAYFSPDKIAFTHLEQDLISELLSAGHEIEVLCPTPTRGISEEVKRHYSKVKEEHFHDGRLHICRFWAPQEGRNPLGRTLRYIWCNLRQYQLGKKYRGVHGIFAVSTPPTQGWLAAKLSKKLDCRFIYSLQDIFPDSLVTTGLARKDSLAWKLGRRIEDSTYKGADTIIAISEAMKRNILQKGVPEEKIQVISNWIDTDAVKPVKKDNNRLFEEFGIRRDRPTVVYAGNFGAAQGACVILEAARLLPDIQFVIFGGGTEFASAKDAAKSLSNAIIHDLLPQERISEVYSLGDLCLITCKKGSCASSMPSKTWSAMACNTPIVAAFDKESELAQVLQEANAGICVEPENAEALAGAILTELVATSKHAGGRGYVCEKANKNVCVSKYVAIMENYICRKDATEEER